MNEFFLLQRILLLYNQNHATGDILKHRFDREVGNKQTFFSSTGGGASTPPDDAAGAPTLTATAPPPPPEKLLTINITTI
jgi:hypothetical protein